MIVKAIPFTSASHNHGLALVSTRIWLEWIEITTYITKVHLCFRETILNNSVVTFVCCGEILGWLTSWELFYAMGELGRSTREKLIVVYGVSQQFLKLFQVTIHSLGGFGSLHQNRNYDIHCGTKGLIIITNIIKQWFLLLILVINNNYYHY